MKDPIEAPIRPDMIGGENQSETLTEESSQLSDSSQDLHNTLNLSKKAFPDSLFQNLNNNSLNKKNQAQSR
jgi:hypothetical protein